MIGPDKLRNNGYCGQTPLTPTYWGWAAWGTPLMKFTLTYDGDLPSTGNNSKKVKEKWAIRKQFSPQLKHLWATHPALIRAIQNRVVPRHEAFALMDTHHGTSSAPLPVPTVTQQDIDLCASIQVGTVSFRPLVRNSYALACSLKILFMRNEPVGRVYQGGDLDNRIKTLLDALSVPQPAQVCEETETHMHCLLEDDALVTGLSVETCRLLNRPDKPESEVRLVIDVTVSVTDARTYNALFLGD